MSIVPKRQRCPASGNGKASRPWHHPGTATAVLESADSIVPPEVELKVPVRLAVKDRPERPQHPAASRKPEMRESGQKVKS